MPPRKKGKAKAPVETPVPDTVFDKNGKGYGSTAALSRPRRESAMVIPPVLANTPKKPASAATTKSAPAPPKKRGRPTKAVVPVEDESEEEVEEEAAVPKRRGRPSKAAATPAATKVKASKKRGRPAKNSAAEVDDDEEEEAAEPPKKKRGPGRPSKASKKRATAPAVPQDETPPPRKRGSSRHGGETTKMEGDDDAAAEQLEDELMEDGAPESTSAATMNGKGAKGKGKMMEADDVDESSSGKQYWLMKAEQEDREETNKNGELVNTKFTIDDLRSKTVPEPWDGVRNPTAAKNMRAMKQGDLAFFYASGGKKGRKPGIVGIMEIVKEAEIDPTTSDKNSIYFVEKEKDRAKWVVVHVEYRKKLTTPVYLSELQKFKESGGALSSMQELIAARLSVSKVSEKEWRFITENLVEGYEEDAEAIPELQGSAANKGNEVEEQTNGDVADEETEVMETEVVESKVVETSTTITHEHTNGNITDDASLPELALPTTENDIATSDTTLPVASSQTSRPASRASPKAKIGGSRASSAVNGKATGSRASSAAKGKGNSSRAGSAAPSAGGLAPPATKGRGRSITPRSRAGSARPADDTAAMQTIGEE